MDAIGQQTAPNDAGTRMRRRARWVARALVVIVIAAVAAFGAGFVWFINVTDTNGNAAPGNADGIVALTGGPFRINDALELLAAGRARRLLITGVNPVTRPVEISRLMPEHQRWFQCCVDIDHSANTIGNAVETRRWVRSRGFKSVIVVTANYHMPRAMAELAHELPDVRLLPYPVVSEKIKAEAWWENPETVRLFLWEYTKYLVARVRLWVPWLFD